MQREFMGKDKSAVLVTGASGFIGTHLCRLLLASHLHVVAIDRTSEGQLAITSRYRFVKCDISDPGQLAESLAEYRGSTLVHLASILKTDSMRDPLRASQVNIQGSLNVLEAARKGSISRLIFGSSISVYGSQRQRTESGTHETDAAAPEDIYGIGKLFVEIAGTQLAEKFGFDFAAFRMATVIGPGASNTNSPWRSEIFEHLASPVEIEVRIPFKANEAFPMIYVEDVAAMIRHLILARHLKHRHYNSPAETKTLSQLARSINSVNRNMILSYGSKIRQGVPSHINGQRFATEFQFQPTSIEEWLRRAVTVISEDRSNPR